MTDRQIDLDADQRNADWIKTLHWDLPTDPDAFLAVIGGRSQLAHFMTLPAAEAMPQSLKAALAEPVETGPHKPHPTKRYEARPKTGIIEPPTRETVIAPPPVTEIEMCCQGGKTAAMHRAESEDGRCCADRPDQQ